MAYAEFDGKRYYYNTGGTEWRAGQPVVILIHGAGFTHAMWVMQSRALAHHGYNVAAIDLPGHGASEDTEIGSVQDYADWLERFREAIGADGVNVAGHSLGACIALTYAATYPQHAASIALVGASLRMPVNPQLLDACLNDMDQAVAFITAFAHGPGVKVGRAAVPGEWQLGNATALLKAGTPKVLHRDFDACNAWDGEAVAGKVQCPALVLSAEQDRMTPVKGGRAMAQAIPGARFEVIPGIGHMLPTEGPRPVLRHLRAFLGEVTAQQAA